MIPGSPGVFPGKGHATAWTDDLEAKPAVSVMQTPLADDTPGRSPRTLPFGLLS